MSMSSQERAGERNQAETGAPVLTVPNQVSPPLYCERVNELPVPIKAPEKMYASADSPNVGITPTPHTVCYAVGMKSTKERASVQLRIYPSSHEKLRRLAFKKRLSLAKVVRDLLSV